MAGAVWVARRFPVLIGRSPTAGLRSEDQGVWERHLQVDFDPIKGFVLTVQQGALASVNGQSVQQATLRNGDNIECGSLRIQFWLSPARQASLRFREAVAWIVLALIPAGQIALICLLSR